LSIASFVSVSIVEIERGRLLLVVIFFMILGIMRSRPPVLVLPSHDGKGPQRVKKTKEKPTKGTSVTYDALQTPSDTAHGGRVVNNPANTANMGAKAVLTGAIAATTAAKTVIMGDNAATTAANVAIMGANVATTGANVATTGANAAITGVKATITGANAIIMGANAAPTGAKIKNTPVRAKTHNVRPEINRAGTANIPASGKSRAYGGVSSHLARFVEWGTAGAWIGLRQHSRTRQLFFDKHSCLSLTQSLHRHSCLSLPPPKNLRTSRSVGS
jgi:hypothetical protein